ncbi:hypothetical protein ERJ70_14175 [Sediminibacillus dalangtanensis]|uniref:Nuclease-related domain-containing protein n=1 Tax=Sediminibacillus dalangtanensis TaxID=2729421 RepID=A0ABX7VWD9_9BACI|nr:hypothetical protein [Sediminibacillus dalangtanensis]QTN00345.1 hypothetical protein ERJ70_14175 [Sediminibacillus dalangtanensis]
MTNVSELLTRDGKHQLYTGIILLFGSGCMILLFLFFAHQWETGLLSIVLAIVGGTVLSRGRHDMQLGRQANLTMQKEKRIPVSRQLDKIMAIDGTLSTKTSVMNLDDERLCVLKETGFQSNLLLRIVRFFYSFGLFLPKNFRFLDDQDNLLFYMQKRGGFSWRAYVFNETGDCIGYICPAKGKKGTLLDYIDQTGSRWRAVKDYRDFISILDQAGKPLLLMKPGAIPLEHAERFSRGDSVVLEWAEAENINYSLLLFILAILKSRTAD